jgi:hypothetical protein
LNDSVTAGNCPWWETESGPILLESIVTSVDSGTAAPVSGDFKYKRSREPKLSCNVGRASRIIE